MSTDLKKNRTAQRQKDAAREPLKAEERPRKRRRVGTNGPVPGMTDEDVVQRAEDAPTGEPAEPSVAAENSLGAEVARPGVPVEEQVSVLPQEPRATADSAGAERPEPAQPAGEPTEGILELHPDGYGFLREVAADCQPSPDDAHVPSRLANRLQLQPGDLVRGTKQPPASKSQGPRLVAVSAVEGRPLEERPLRRDFNSLTPINPESWLRLETTRNILTTRVIDLIAPLGRGQRGLIVAPPRSGKTVLLQQIGQAVAANYPEVKVVVLLVDERPEEVTDMRRNIPGQVFASSLDQGPERHVRLSRLVLERCKRLVEDGEHVLLLIDSITRISRAFNKWVGNTGRTMSGGVDIKALEVPRRMFATARAFEEGGSLTILATALVETGSRMDDVIFEEFKGAGNMELTLDRQLAERRIWPAIDIQRSGTRREEKLWSPAVLDATTALRRVLNTMRPLEAMEHLTSQLAKYNTNREFIAAIRHRLSE